MSEADQDKAGTEAPLVSTETTTGRAAQAGVGTPDANDARTENAPLVFQNRIARKKPENIRHTQGYCPFCDRDSLEGIIRTDGDCIWLLNKYRTLEDTMQTVLIESRNHDGDQSNYTTTENRHIFRFALECWGDMLRSGKYASVLMYKNFGPNSGGSLRHPHFQIVGLDHKNGYERVPANAFDGVDVYRSGERAINLSTHPVMGFVEVNTSIPETDAAGMADPGDIDWLADAVQQVICYMLESYHGRGCDSYNLFFYRVGKDGLEVSEADGRGRIVCKVIPRWITSPYFVGYRISQVDCTETLEAVADDIRPLIERIG